MATSAVAITLLAFAALILAYVFYGRFMARRIFQLDDSRPTPAHTLEDGVDYVPTRTPVLFGHHFASIAGLGPILGPAVAVIWGWLPAVLWVVFGCIFIGAVHDLGALTVSMRYKGRSIGDVCQDIIGPRSRFLFLLVIFFLMSLAMGAFVNAISSLFVNFNPDAIIPSFGLMLVAMAIGMAVYRLKVGLGPATVVGLVAFGGLIAWGVVQPVRSYEWHLNSETNTALAEARESGELASPYGAAAAQAYFASQDNSDAASAIGAASETTRFTWIFILLAYGFVASVLPVWLLLQPRDYINSFQLYIALATLTMGLIVAAATGASAAVIDAPIARYRLEGSPPLFPILFVTIACGAVSGFHSMVSSGTTVRQLDRESNALPIGFGGMLTEGALAILVIMACVAGLGAAAWNDGGMYTSWENTKGLGVRLNAVVHGGANYLSLVGIPFRFGTAFLAVTIVAFAMTTLDSATRLLRFNVEEILRSVGLGRLANRYLASAVAVAGIATFGLVPAGQTLWVLFGTTNQLLAALTLLTVSLFLYKLGRPVIYTVIPMILMLIVTISAMVTSLQTFLSATDKSWLLIGTSVFVLVMTFWLFVEGCLSFARGRGGLTFDEPAEKKPPTPSEITA